MSHLKPHIIQFKEFFSAYKGGISIAEKSELPISVKRVYWTYDFPGSDIKGNHANVKTEFIVVCISGKAFIKVIDKFNSHTDFLLDSSSKGVYIPPAYWREIQASEGSVVLVLASEEYLDSDYIRVREDFFI